jgi:hypothetical protein
MMLALLILHYVQFSRGAHGFVIWIQPPHISAGIGLVRGHLVTWRQL